MKYKEFKAAHSDGWYQDKYGWDGDGVKLDYRRRHFGEVFTPRWIVEKLAGG